PAALRAYAQIIERTDRCAGLGRDRRRIGSRHARRPTAGRRQHLASAFRAPASIGCDCGPRRQRRRGNEECGMNEKRDRAHSPGHLLIVDDDALLRGMAAKTLLHAGFEVSEAASGEDALARIGEAPYDLILLDVMMSGIDGYEVCQRIRAMEHGARVPILM